MSPSVKSKIGKNCVIIKVVSKIWGYLTKDFGKEMPRLTAVDELTGHNYCTGVFNT